MIRHLLATLAIASALSGCSVVGATVSVARARNANYQRELAIARGDKDIPARAEVGQSGMAGFFAGAIVDGLVIAAYEGAVLSSFGHAPQPAPALP